MSPDDPRHGSNAGATAHWVDNEPPCDACARAKSRENKALQVDRLAGRPRIVTLGERAHQALTRTPVPEAARLTGLSQFTIRRLIEDGPNARLRRVNKEQLGALRSASSWTCLGLQRRIQALHAIGWSCAAIARESGVHVDTIVDIRIRAPKQSREASALAIVAAYDALSMRLPPVETQRDRAVAAKSRRRAATEGWAPPLAWDDIDDPNETPSGARPAAESSPPPAKGAKGSVWKYLEDADWLADGDLSLTEVLERLGVNRDTFRDACRREGRNDLYVRLSDREPDADDRRATRAGIQRARSAA